MILVIDFLALLVWMIDIFLFVFMIQSWSFSFIPLLLIYVDALSLLSSAISLSLILSSSISSDKAPAFSFQLMILYWCALFWIIFLTVIFDLAHGFSISTVLITPVFVFFLCHGRFMLFFLFLGDYSCICWCLSLPVITLCFNFILCFAQLFFWFYSCFYRFSLPLICSRWFLIDFHASFLLVKSIQSSLSLFVLVICLWLCFWNSILFGINILDNFSLHNTVSSYNLDLNFVCQHFSMPLHVSQSLLCVEYCDCWFYSKIFMIPFVISIDLC